MAPFCFVNYPLETFTPTKSGAIATIIWECCRKARTQGVTPWVITRSSDVRGFEWPQSIQIPYPEVPANRPGLFLAKVMRKLGGWRHLMQGTYIRSVVRVIKQRLWATGTFVIFNDPEGVIALRRSLPDAVLVHWFQNQMETSERLRDKFVQAADIIVACSAFTAEWVQKHYALPSGRVKVVYNAVDSDLFRPQDPRASGLPVLNFVGRTGIEKGPDIFLAAALQLAERGLRFEVQMVGSNHWDRFEEDDFQRKLSSLVWEIEKHGIVVRRTGHVGREHLPPVLARADINVIPARWDEPFGMTTVEGMACGLATVASATGGTPEVIGDAGLLFARESVGELASCLSHLLADAPLRLEFAQKARSRAEQFNWARTWSDLWKHAAARPVS